MAKEGHISSASFRQSPRWMAFSPVSPGNRAYVPLSSVTLSPPGLRACLLLTYILISGGSGGGAQGARPPPPRPLF